MLTNGFTLMGGLGDLRFGSFNGDGLTDVLAMEIDVGAKKFVRYSKYAH
jgi:hypothetical protein